MAFILNDRVKQTSTTAGTISMVVDGSLTGFVTFTAGIGDTNTTYYTIVGEDVASEWEVGIGTYTSSGTSLSRDTIINSSTGSKVDFSAGTKVVFCTMPGEKIAYKDSSGNAVNSVSYIEGGTNFTGSLKLGDTTTGTLNAAQYNIGIGKYSLGTITSGDYNTCVGGVSINALSTGTGNSALGYSALQNVTGDKNIGLGYQSGNNISSGSGNVVIGNADVASATGDDQLSIADGEDGSVVWISGDSSGNLTVAGTVTADSQLLVGAGFAIAMSVAL